MFLCKLSLFCEFLRGCDALYICLYGPIYRQCANVVDIRYYADMQHFLVYTLLHGIYSLQVANNLTATDPHLPTDLIKFSHTL